MSIYLSCKLLAALPKHVPLSKCLSRLLTRVNLLFAISSSLYLRVRRLFPYRPKLNCDIIWALSILTNHPDSIRINSGHFLNTILIIFDNQSLFKNTDIIVFLYVSKFLMYSRIEAAIFCVEL